VQSIGKDTDDVKHIFYYIAQNNTDGIVNTSISSKFAVIFFPHINPGL